MSQLAGLPCALVAGFVSAATNRLMLDAVRAPLGVLVYSEYILSTNDLSNNYDSPGGQKPLV
jgi:hypothetical protein